MNDIHTINNSIIDIRYMYDNQWKNEFKNACQEKLIDKSAPYIVTVEDGVILPLKKEGDRPIWGKDGVLDKNDEFIKETKVAESFGGKYNYDSKHVEYLHETIVYIGVIPRQWGHFIIDTLCRLWYFIDRTELKDFKIAFCGWGWQNNEITGNYLETLKLLGIESEKLLFITNPVRVDKILIPSMTMGFSEKYNKKFKSVTNKIIEKVFTNETIRNLDVYDKIYFTRRKFAKNKYDVGEKEIEEYFNENGFKVLSPEKLTAAEQIYYINKCKVLACMQGTLSHNCVFMQDNGKLVMINRTGKINPPQLRLNQLYGINCVYIDAYAKRIEKHPIEYGQLPLWVEVNDNLKRYFLENRMKELKPGVLRGLYIKLRNFMQYYFLLAKGKTLSFIVGSFIKKRGAR